MRRYSLRAQYLVTKRLVVQVPDGYDPEQEAFWAEIEDEHDMDCVLYDVVANSAVELDETEE